MSWLCGARGCALVSLALATGACSTTHVAGDADVVADASTGIDATALDGGDRDAARELDDGGSDAGPPGALGVFGGLGTVSGGPSSGGVVIVDDGFDVGGWMCGGSICAYGGFR